MAAVIENREPCFGVAQRLLVGLGSAHRHQIVLAAPDDLRWQAAYAVEEVRQAGVMENGLPGDARGFGTRVLKGLELLRSSLATVKFGELRSGLRIVDAQVERRTLGYHEDIEDFILGWFYSQR